MSNIVEVKVPDIGDFRDVPVIEVLVGPGDRVKQEDSLITLESDKATMEVPSPASGVVKEVRVKVGDKVSQGSSVVVLEAGDGAAAGHDGTEPAAAVAEKPAAAPEKARAPEKKPAPTAKVEPAQPVDPLQFVGGNVGKLHAVCGLRLARSPCARRSA